MHDTSLIRSDVQLHPETPVAAPAGLPHLGSWLALVFLVELGAATMVASTMVPSAATAAVLPATRRNHCIHLGQEPLAPSHFGLPNPRIEANVH
jgi:hypothetical protein